MPHDPNRFVGYESSKSYAIRCESGFWDIFITGSVVIDIGYRGARPDALTIVEEAVGIEFDTPGYNGFDLPYTDETVDTVHASHLLEHVDDPIASLREWFRVLRPYGTLILMVPHAYLYERRLTVPPSRWSPEHRRAYSPATLLRDVEAALVPNSYRVRHLADNDHGYDYRLPLEVHPNGCLEIELVIQKIKPPAWTVEP